MKISDTEEVETGDNEGKVSKGPNTGINAITDDAKIKQGLFPPPGANVSIKNGGGKPKTEHQWALFTEHPVYSSSSVLVKTAKDKERWVNKIKNRLKKYSCMITKTHEYMEEMGQIGTGIKREADINMDTPNAFATKWAQIKSVWPWFFEMRELIGQRPNVIPAGLGNSETGFASSVMLKHESDDDNHAGGIDDLEVPAYDSDDEKSDATAATAGTKRKAVVIKDEPKKRHKLASGATQKSKRKSKPKSLIEKFEES
ncbi:hypothetical protein AZE42_12933 [Rhizopogon vesiculosus]|uniref:Uncharacterized protein n=1 Tax=Rhizopogon vesiculosus TaxID=180088 RepID=A0A1J8QLC0_9AGAM|nr:hypothetical protein AZE42_12933 [Rhizopogon vesiculosus]